MKTKNYLIGIFLSVGLFAFVSVVGAANWDPLVKIPGIPTTGINLSTYLVGLYNFMLSVVGIVAVMMLIVAGMRYITAAGNATSVTDAKSIAGNAVVGLLLALLSFVILKTINPDVLYLKKPGSGFAGTTGTPVDLGSCGSYDSAGVCTCANNEIITPAVANAAACNTACEASPELCRAAPKNPCLNPNITPDKEDDINKICHCIDNLSVKPTAAAIAGRNTCNEICSDTGGTLAVGNAYHGINWDVRVGNDVDSLSAGDSFTTEILKTTYFDVSRIRACDREITHVAMQFSENFILPVIFDPDRLCCNPRKPLGGCQFNSWGTMCYINPLLRDCNESYSSVGYPPAPFTIFDVDSGNQMFTTSASPTIWKHRYVVPSTVPSPAGTEKFWIGVTIQDTFGITPCTSIERYFSIDVQ